MLWYCVPVALKVVRATIDALIRAATLNEARYVFLYVLMNQTRVALQALLRAGDQTDPQER